MVDRGVSWELAAILFDKLNLQRWPDDNVAIVEVFANGTGFFDVAARTLFKYRSADTGRIRAGGRKKQRKRMPMPKALSTWGNDNMVKTACADLYTKAAEIFNRAPTLGMSSAPNSEGGEHAELCSTEDLWTCFDLHHGATAQDAHQFDKYSEQQIQT